MSFYKTKNLATGVVIAVSAALPAVADNSNIYINPAIGFQDFDSDRQLDSEELISIGAEYRIDKHWAAEFSIMDSSPELKGSSSDLDLTQYGIDGIYYFKERDYFGMSDKFQPYGAVGVGHAEFDGDNNTDDETQLRFGLGVRYLLDEHWSVKADTKMLYGTDDDTRDGLVTLGISYAFNEQSAKRSEPAAAVDGDGDGVSDSRDQCANTPAGVNVDANGCALDDDGDGVANYRDECPDTPAGRQVDDKGCKFVLTSTEELTLNVNFPSNSSIVGASYNAEIEKAAKFMNKYAAVDAVIEGHTDDTGSAEYNETLSQRRANAVMKALVERFGIDASRLSAKGYGEARPIEANDTVGGRSANRRVVAVMQAEVQE